MAVPLRLKVFKGDQLIASKDYDRDIIKIGRLSSAHLCLEDDKVSRIHSVIEVAADSTLSIIDMGSVEGTFVNDKRVTKGALQFGDEIKVGGTTIRVERGEAVSSASISDLPPVLNASAVSLEPVPLGGDEATGQQQAMMVPLGGSLPSMMPVQNMVVETGRTQPMSPVMMPVQVAQPQPPPAPYVPPQPAPQPRVVPTFEAEAPMSGSARARPRRRKGTGPLGLELRFLWGEQIVGEFFLAPSKEGALKIGSAKGVDFVMGDGKLGGPVFVVARMGKNGAQLRFTDKMTGELQRKFGEQILSLNEAKRSGAAQADGDANALTLGSDDFAWVDLGGITVEAFFQPVPKTVFVPFAETVDFTLLNIFLVMFFLGALFVITAINRSTEGAEYADELSDSNARIAKLLIKPPDIQKSLAKYEKKKDSGEVAQKHKGGEGEMGKKDAPKKSAHAAPKGDPTNKDQARLLMQKVFGASGGGISTIFGHQGLGGELKSAMGNMFGAAAGDSGGLGGLGLRGSGSGGGGVGDTVGIGGIGTRGRGGGTGGYGSGVGVLGGKQSTDIGITSSEPTVMGSLDKELIRKVIHANRGQIRYCYESQLNRFPKLNGKVAVKFVISAQGSVATSSIALSTVNNAELEACVAGRVRTWIFPKPKGGGVVIVTYPFLFSQSGQAAGQ